MNMIEVVEVVETDLHHNSEDSAHMFSRNTGCPRSGISAHPIPTQKKRNRRDGTILMQ